MRHWPLGFLRARGFPSLKKPPPPRSPCPLHVPELVTVTDPMVKSADGIVALIEFSNPISGLDHWIGDRDEFYTCKEQEAF
jgi:hypothetical protein